MESRTAIALPDGSTSRLCEPLFMAKYRQRRSSICVNSIQGRYDEFQREAVAAIEADFTKNPAGRYALVIPTGGGKTFTAVKSVNRLFETGVLDAEAQTVMWVAHRDLLLRQATETFARFEELYPEQKSFRERVTFVMSTGAGAAYRSDASVGLVVIDEAHHSAANSYLPLFERKDVGVLGLTATPTRHDGAPLEFERETFSIGFPDLVETGVILKPEVTRVEGGRYEIVDLDDTAAGVFDNEKRNQAITQALLDGRERYNKIVVYVGTVAHVKSLHRLMCDSALSKHYESISYITGDANSRGSDRDSFLMSEKAIRRSIVVNVMVLAEGYDDPSVDTVVMAMPTKSKLVYMQCMGRAVRRDPDNPDKEAHIVELVDDLPNIRYRIDNRWLYADVADVLEPEVIDCWYDSEDTLRSELERTCSEYHVPDDHIPEVTWDRHDRYGMFLFKSYVRDGEYVRFPIVVTRNNRRAVLDWFNYLSCRAPSLRAQGWQQSAVMPLSLRFDVEELGDAEVHARIVESLLNAAESHVAEPSASMMAAHPWITYVSFRYRRTSLPAGLEEFLADVVNRDLLISQVRERAYSRGSRIVKVPQPLSGYVGRIVDEQEAEELTRYVGGLTAVQDAVGEINQADRVIEYERAAVFPLEQRYMMPMTTIVRESTDYLFELP